MPRLPIVVGCKIHRWPVEVISVMASPVVFFLESTDLPFMHGHKNSMRNDQFYWDPEYAWDAYIRA